eukprot:m.174965 g.174965  ORF g.174965 m.174965 type:complete len:359 (-) comp24384_c0_seq1:837-1913(-)
MFRNVDKGRRRFVGLSWGLLRGFWVASVRGSLGLTLTVWFLVEANLSNGCLVVPRIDFVESLDHVGFNQPDAVQLVPQGGPIWLDVMGPPEKFELAGTGRQPLDQTIDFVGLLRGLSELCHEYITVEHPIRPCWVPFDPNQTMLFGMIEPVTRAPGVDDLLQLVRLKPEQFLHDLKAPFLHAPSSKLHRTVRDPEEDIRISVGQLSEGEIHHLGVFHRAVRQVHVNPPRRICHNNGELPENFEVKFPNVALDPLWWAHPFVCGLVRRFDRINPGTQLARCCRSDGVSLGLLTCCPSPIAGTTCCARPTVTGTTASRFRNEWLAVELIQPSNVGRVHLVVDELAHGPPHAICEERAVTE